MPTLFPPRLPTTLRVGTLLLGLCMAGSVFADAPPPVPAAPAAAAAPSTPAPVVEPPAPVLAQPAPAVEPPAPVAPAGPQVSIKTTKGEIVVELNQEKAPKTVANFLQYVKSGNYTNTIFHRVINGFMIQAGGMDAKFAPRPTNKPVKNESNNGLSNVKYSIAMARENHPDSATSQWFINVADNTGLDHPNMKGSGYTVFGKVVAGHDVVDKIKGVVVDDPRPVLKNVPVVPIVIKSVTLIKKK